MNIVSPVLLLRLAVTSGLMLTACSEYAPPPHAASAPAGTATEPAHVAVADPQPSQAVVPTPPSHDEVFASLFLSHEEVGANKQLVEERDSSRSAKFRAEGGIRTRSVRWVERGAAEVVRTIRDDRWMFSDESHAKAFFGSWTTTGLEAYVPIEAIASVGDESRVFSCPRAESSGPLQDMYVFVFRAKNVVASITVERGSRAPEGSLTPEKAFAFARLAEQRIGAALAARGSP
jgi:hypothetical protein